MGLKTILDELRYVKKCKGEAILESSQVGIIDYLRTLIGIADDPTEGKENK